MMVQFMQVIRGGPEPREGGPGSHPQSGQGQPDGAGGSGPANPPAGGDNSSNGVPPVVPPLISQSFQGLTSPGQTDPCNWATSSACTPGTACTPRSATFDSKVEKVSFFMVQTAEFLQSWGETFPDEASQVSYLASRLEGSVDDRNISLYDRQLCLVRRSVWTLRAV